MGKYAFILFSILLFSFSVLKSQKKEIVIKGIVKEEQSKNDVEGASVRLSGSSHITSTNKNGEFVLRLPQKAIY